nr:universal stress protein [uncultured Dyadobacter sp.]
MKKILAPFDFSPSAMHALHFAIDIAAANDSEVFVLKVLEFTPLYIESINAIPFYADSASVLADLKEQARNNFEELRWVIDSRVPVHFGVEQGALSQTVLQAIRQHEIDLVVMGTKGSSGISELLIGSNTEKIVRSSPVPVFAIHKQQKISAVRNIIVPTTLDYGQASLMEKIKMLQNFFHARLHLLFIKTPYVKETDHALHADLESLAQHYGLNDYVAHVRHEFDEEKGILKFAAKLGYSIIAMGTHGFTGLTHLMLGSIAENVVNHTHEAVWTYAMQESV